MSEISNYLDRNKKLATKYIVCTLSPILIPS